MTAPDKIAEARATRDLLRMDHINSLPQPFFVQFFGGPHWWPVNDFEVQTGLMRIDVGGLLQVMDFAEVKSIKDGCGDMHDPESFYSDYVPPVSTADRIAAAPALRDAVADLADGWEAEKARADALGAELARWKEAAGAHHVASMNEAQRADQNAVRADALAQENAKLRRALQDIASSREHDSNCSVHMGDGREPCDCNRAIARVALGETP